MPRGICKIFNWDGSGTSYDIKQEWGVSLSDGAISTLLAPPAAKPRVSNESRLEDGKRVNVLSPVYFQSRELSLEMHLIAASFEDFLTKWRGFIAALNASGEGINLQFQIYGQTINYRLRYLSCTQFAAYNGTLGKFIVRFEESQPSNGTSSLTLGTTSNNEGGGEI